MMPNSALGSAERPSIMSYNKSTLIIWVVISLLVSETLAGAARYYFDQAGLSALLYLPKVACLILFVVELLTYKATRIVWLSVLVLVLYSALAMLHGASFKNVAFSLYSYCPLFFGVVCSQHIIYRKKLLGWVIAACLIASVIGLLLDKYISVPWKGYTYTLGGTELSGNTTWADDESDRLAGFTRLSSMLSTILAIFSLYCAMFTRSRIMLCVIAVVGFYSILLTTSKGPTVALVITFGIMAISRLRWTSAAVFILIVAMGFLLPIAGFAIDFNPNNITSGDRSLMSLYDRLINTWPHIAEYLYQEGWRFTGAGLGMFGTTQVLFPVPGSGILGVSDNSAMYLWGTFGVIGIALYALQARMFFVLRDGNTRIDNALLAITICICITGWTTDMFENAISNLFIGLAIGRALSNAAATSSAPITNPHRLDDFSVLPDLR